MKRFTEAIARFIERRPWWLLLAVLILSAAAVPGVTLLESETGFAAFIEADSEIAQDNARYEAEFGGDPMSVMLEGSLDDVFSTENLAVLEDFEQRFSADPRYRSVVGPLTVLQAAIEEVELARQTLEEQLALAQEAAAAQARAEAAAMGLGEAEQEMAAQQAAAAVLEQFQPQIDQLELIGEASLDNLAFVAYVLYDDGGAVSPAMEPFIFDESHVMIAVTPEGNMTDEEDLDIALVVEDYFSAHPLDGVDVTVIAASKLVNAISTSLGGSIMMLLVLAILVMILVLVVMFRVRWRLLSLFMVGVAALWTFGLLGYASVPVTMATMAVLPILIGLGIDYSIQFQNRYHEELITSKTVGEAIVGSLPRMLPSVGIALLATVIGFITLFISEVPMLREFGMALAVGIAFSFLVAIFLLHSIIYLGDRKKPVAKLRKESKEASGRIERVLIRVGRLAINHTLWIFIIAVLFGVGGGVVDHLLPQNTDYEDLMPQDIEVLQELRAAREITGSGGSIHFMIEADDVTSQEMLNWLKDYEDESLAAHSKLISVSSPATLVSEAAGGVIPSQGEIDAILAETPAIYLDQVVNADRNVANVSFSIVHMDMEDINEMVKEMEEEAGQPAGVDISPVGSIVLGCRTMDAIMGNRFALNFICLGAIFVVLLLLYRRLSRALFVIIPTGTIIAWSSMDMFIMGVPLNPLTSVLGILMIGICAEYMVLLTGRYEEEKKQGLEPAEAMVTAISKIGRAVVVSSVTTLGGFGVLIASNFVMVSDFGIATVISVLLCVLMTIAVMPGVIVWYDRWRGKRLSRL